MVAAGCSNSKLGADVAKSNVTFRIFVKDKSSKDKSSNKEQEIQPIEGKYHVKAGQDVCIKLEYTERDKQYWKFSADYHDSTNHEATYKQEHTDEYGKAVIMIDNFCGSMKREYDDTKYPALKGFKSVQINMNLLSLTPISQEDMFESTVKAFNIYFFVEEGK
ncbi:MAG: hypothetical protein AAFP88_01580 [Bacteroidota bacterium]